MQCASASNNDRLSTIAHDPNLLDTDQEATSCDPRKGDSGGIPYF